MNTTAPHDCVFCRIVAGETAAEVVYDDSGFLGFMDIDPAAPGHVLVIPKEHYRWVWDVPEVGQYFEVVRTIARAQQRAFDTDWIRSRVVGDEVPHAHVWIFPGDAAEDRHDLAGNAEKIRDALR